MHHQSWRLIVHFDIKISVFSENCVFSGFSVLLLNRNFIHALLMAAAFESSGEEFVHNLAGHIVVDETTWHHQNVGVVVLTNEMSDLRNPAQTSTYLLVLYRKDKQILKEVTNMPA